MPLASGSTGAGKSSILDAVTLALDPQDVQRVMSSLFAKGDRAKYFEFPSAVYAMHPFDEVRCDGKAIGVSTWIGYSSNEGRMLSLAMIDPAYVEMGKQVTLVWGEENGGTNKTTVERHRQAEIRVVVSPVPYAKVVRETYQEGSLTEAPDLSIYREEDDEAPIDAENADTDTSAEDPEF